jgi:hypothetical protein
MSQIKKKFIENNAIDGTKFQLLNGQTLRAVDNSGSDRDLFYFSNANEWYLSVNPKISVDPQAANDLTRKSYVDGLASAEASARAAADAAEQSRAEVAEGKLTTDLASEVSRAQGAEASIASDLAAEILRAETAEAGIASDLAVETSRAQAAESALSGRLDVIEGSGEGSIAKAKSDAQAYADQKISDLIASAPAVLDTLKELADALGDDPNFATTVANQIGSEAAARQIADAAETQAREAADLQLTSDLAKEATDRALADSTEATARQAADQALQIAIDSEATARQIAVSAEQSAREAADQALQIAIDSEATARQAAVAAEASARDAAIAAEASARQTAIDAETSSRQAAVFSETSARQAAVDAETSRAQAAEASLASSVSSEASARIAAVAAEASARDAAIAAEASRAQAAEAGLSSDLASEASARQSADDQISSSLMAETSRAQAAEASLASGLAQEASDRQAAIAAEAVSRQTDVTTLTGLISSEALRAQAAENSLSGSVAAETSRAQAAETSLAGAVNAEALRAQAAEAQALNDAKSYTDTKVAAVVDSAPAVLDTLNKLAQSLANDPNLATTIAGEIGSEASRAQAAESAEQSRAMAAEAALRSDIDVESQQRQAADIDLANQVTGEIGRAQTVEASLQAAIGSESSRAMAAEATLQSNIYNEITRAQDFEASLQSSIEAEALAREAADSAEQSRAQATEASLQSNIDAEISARQAAVAAINLAIQNVSPNLDGLADVMIANKADKDLVQWSAAAGKWENVAPISVGSLSYASLEQELTAPQYGSQFGYVAISADGTTMAVGAYQENGNLYSDGAVHVYTKSNGTWTEQAKLLASDANYYMYFGREVSLSDDGNTLAVGAYNQNKDNTTSGTAYVFTRSGSTWTQAQELVPSNAAWYQQFGYSIRISGDASTVVVGAVNENNGTGSIFVYKKTGTSYAEEAHLVPGDAQYYELLGYEVAISHDGNTVVAGAPYQNPNGAGGQGSAYVYTRSGSTWTQAQKLEPSVSGYYDYFGSSLAISGDASTVIVGAYNHSSQNSYNNGAAFVFTGTPGSYTQQQEVIAGDKQSYSQFGWSVALSPDGTIAAVGARSQSTTPNSNDGAVYVYTVSSGTLSQRSKIVASDAQSYAGLGMSVSLGSDHLVAGAPGNQGKAYVYSLAIIGSPTGVLRTNDLGQLDTSFLQYNLNLGGNILSGVLPPSASTDASNKYYVDAQINSVNNNVNNVSSNLNTLNNTVSQQGTRLSHLTLASGLQDVSASGAGAGDLIRYDGTTWKLESPLSERIAGQGSGNIWNYKSVWKFDELEGNLIDSAGSNYLISSGNIIYGLPGATATGTAISFDGTAFASSVHTLDGWKTSPTDFSVSVWIKTSGSYGVVWTMSADNGQYGPALNMNGSDVLLYNWPNGNLASQMVNIGDNNWHHILVSWGIAGTKLYIDGVLNSQTSDTIANYQMINSGFKIRIGQGFNGSMDKLALFNNQLADADVASIYSSLDAEFVPGGNLRTIKTTNDGYIDQSFLQYNVNFGGNKLSGVATPTADTDTANKKYVDDTVAAATSGENSAIAAEASRAQAAEGAISSSLAAEVSRAQAAEVTLTSDLAAEVSRAEAAESVLQSNINAENSARTAADTAIESALGAEAVSRASSDSALKAEIDSYRPQTASITLTSIDVTNGFVEFTPVNTFISGSLMCFVGRLFLCEGEDYTTSFQDGKISLTFTGSFAVGQSEGAQEGDRVLCRYLSIIPSTINPVSGGVEVISVINGGTV